MESASGKVGTNMKESGKMEYLMEKVHSLRKIDNPILLNSKMERF